VSDNLEWLAERYQLQYDHSDCDWQCQPALPMTRGLIKALIDVAKAADDEHRLLHPGGTQQMADGELQLCPICDGRDALDASIEKERND
jgi:hypothetical protein